jgi:uncharacterized protein (DUF1684 family)
MLFNHQFFSQNQFKSDIKKFRDELNKEYADSITSPLLKEDLLNFKGLKYYPVNKSFKVEAKFFRTPDELPFKMKTSTNRTPEYLKFGDVEFNLKGKIIKVPIYQSIKLKEKEEYKDYLFLPFRDLTSGKNSYGGGRYIDLKIPEGETIIIDFNKAYNPYCAYNHKYSCVVPPAENFINVKVKAGVKKYGNH